MVDSQSNAEFHDRRGNKVVTISRDKIHQVFLINLTLDHLGPFAPNVATLPSVQQAPEGARFWSVSLPDLFVFAEVLDRPSLLLHYLRRRMALWDHPSVRSFDELNFLMYYVRKGLVMRDKEVEGFHFFNIDSHTEELDRYYQAKEQSEPAECPRPRLPDFLEKMLRAIEANPRAEAASCAMALLDFAGDAREEVASKIAFIDEHALAEDRMRDFAVGVDPHEALLFACSPHPIAPNVIEKCVTRWLNERGRRIVYLFCWSPPLGSSDVDTRAFFDRQHIENPRNISLSPAIDVDAESVVEAQKQRNSLKRERRTRKRKG
jgi:hypothetical protein